MMQLTTPVLGLYRNSEFIRYNKDVATICGNNNAKVLKIEAQVNNLQAATAPLDDLFMIERGNLITEELEALDARRDAAITGIQLAANAFAYHFNEPQKKAGIALQAGIEKYGKGLARLNYIAETEVIESLVADLVKNPELNEAVATLGLQNWVDELGQANQLFNQRYIARTSDYASKPQGSLTQLRVATATVYNELAAHITAHATLTPSEGYAKLINELNSLTDQYNKLANSRGGNSDNQQTNDNGGADNGNTVGTVPKV